MGRRVEEREVAQDEEPLHIAWDPAQSLFFVRLAWRRIGRSRWLNVAIKATKQRG